MNNYLKVYCEEILNDLGYSYTNEDIDMIVNVFDGSYLADFEAYEDKENSD